MFWHASVLLSVHRGGSVQLGGVEGSVSQLSRGGECQSSWGWGGSVQPVSQAGCQSGGGRSVSQDRTTEWVLTTWRAVCLLRSRRRTFLFMYVFINAMGETVERLDFINLKMDIPPLQLKNGSRTYSYVNISILLWDAKNNCVLIALRYLIKCLIREIRVANVNNSLFT